MSRVLSLTDEQRDQIARESLDHGQLLDNAFAAGVAASTAAVPTRGVVTMTTKTSRSPMTTKPIFRAGQTINAILAEVRP